MHRHRHKLAASLMFMAMLPFLAACDSGTSPNGAATAVTGPSANTGGLAAGAPSQPGSSTANLTIESGASIAGNPEIAVGTVAPDFSLPGLDGNTYSLSSEKGKVVVIEFMATWCPHCQNDAPLMNQLDAAYKGKNVQIFAINAATQGHTETDPATMGDLQWFKDTFKVTFPLLFDTKLKSANDYGVSFYPSVFMVDQQGKIAVQPPDNQFPALDLYSGEIDKILAGSSQ